MPRYEDLTSFPAVRQDLAGGSPADVPAADVVETVRGAGGALLRQRRGLRRLPGAQAGEGVVARACASTFRAADRTLTDEDVAPVRERSSPRCATSSEVSCVGERSLVAGAAGLRGRAGRARSCTAIRTSSSPPSPRARTSACGSATCYPHHRVPLVARGARPRPPRRRRRGDRRLPARRGARPSSPSCASAACASSTFSADFRLRDRGDLRASGTASTGAGAVRHRRLRPARALPRRRSPTPTSSPAPGCFPTAALLALAPLARGGLVADVVIDAKTGVSGAGARRDQRTHFVSVDENVAPYEVAARTATRRRSTRSCARRDAGDGDVRPAPPAARPGRAAVLLRDDDAAASQPELLERYVAAYADEPFVELVDRPPGVRDVRETNLCRIHVHAERADRQGPRLRGDRQPLEGHVLAGRAVPEPHVRPRRDRAGPRRACHPRAGSSRRAGARPARSCRRRLLPGGFRACGVAAGLKPRGASTSGCSSASSRRPTSAARFTALGRRSPRRSLLCRERSALDAIRTIVANSGNANAATGSRGLEEAARMQGAAGDGRRRARGPGRRRARPASSACSSTARR